MSIQFERPMNEETRRMIEEMFSQNVAAMDDKTVLVNEFRCLSNEMTALANTAKQPVCVEIHGDGEIKTMSDGTQYRVTPQGWRKITA